MSEETSSLSPSPRYDLLEALLETFSPERFLEGKLYLVVVPSLCTKFKGWNSARSVVEV